MFNAKLMLVLLVFSILIISSCASRTANNGDLGNVAPTNNEASAATDLDKDILDSENLDEELDSLDDDIDLDELDF